MKAIVLTTTLAAFAAPVAADSMETAITHFNQAKTNSEQQLVTTGSTRGEQHNARAQAIFDRIEAANEEDE